MIKMMAIKLRHFPSTERDELFFFARLLFKIISPVTRGLWSSYHLGLCGYWVTEHGQYDQFFFWPFCHIFCSMKNLLKDFFQSLNFNGTYTDAWMFRLYIYNVFLREISICVLSAFVSQTLPSVEFQKFLHVTLSCAVACPENSVCLSLLELPALSFQFSVSTRLCMNFPFLHHGLKTLSRQ